MLTASIPLLIRTDFANDARWTEIRDAATATVPIQGGEGGGGDDAAPNVQVVDDAQFDELLAVNLSGVEDESKTFRLIPTAMAMVEPSRNTGGPWGPRVSGLMPQGQSARS